MNFQKLKNASLEELRVRASQRMAAFSERRGWSSLVKLPSDPEFDSLLNFRSGKTDHFLDYVRSRTYPPFFGGFKNTQETSVALKSRRPETVQRIIEQANGICEGKFQLLGLRDLSFGDPIDWHFEPITGKRIPLVHWSKLDYLDAEIAGDKKIIWELNRHQYFMTLGQAYWLTNDERYAATFVSHLEAWMDANPPKLGINWASSLEVAFRSISWLWALYYFKASPSLSRESLLRAWKFLYLSARHLESYLSTYFSPNTHLTGEALGLFYLGTLMPEFREAKRWQELGSRILVEQVPVHVQGDGVYFEQSSYYHRYTTDFYAHFVLLSRANNLRVPKEVEKSLVLLLDHLMYITRPDGTTPFFGDDDGGCLAKLDYRAANDFRSTLATGSVLFNRGDYKFVAGEAAEALLWLTGVEGLNSFDSIAATQPGKTSVPFFEGGYFVMRDGWTKESNYLLFDCGPHGSLNCGHAHSDALSFELASHGRAILVDPGTYTYTGLKELRDWFRSSAAHNTLTVDDESSSVPHGSFSWKTVARCSLKKWISNDRFDFVEGQHDGFMRLQDPVMVTREILFIKRNYWVVRDSLSSKDQHRVNAHFHFDSAARPLLDGGELDVESGFRIRCFGNGKSIEEDGWISHCYGQRDPAKVLVFSTVLGGGQGIVSFLVPKRTETDWKVTEIEACGGRAYVVYGDKTRDLVIIRTAERVKTLGFVTADKWLWVRFSPGQTTQSQEIISLSTSGTSQELSAEEIETLRSKVMALDFE